MKTLLLLAMSTYHNYGLSNFYFKESDVAPITDCDGQLEPIVKYAVRQYPESDLEIVMLCTSETLADKAHGEMSSVEYFESRVRSFCQNDKVAFKVINIDEDNPTQGICDAVQHIRKCQHVDHFWIDTHGGFRDITLSLEAIISLLKVDGIFPEQVFGVQYTDKSANRDKQNYIVRQDDSFALFDFVAGMNEFIGFGSVKMLQNYYRTHEANVEEKRLLQAMQEISDGAEESNPGKYIAGLDHLGSVINDNSAEQTKLLLFKEYIRSSYGDLLDPNKREVIGIIERCIDKGLIVQALMFMESLMPSEFISHGIMRYDAQKLRKYRDSADDSSSGRFPKWKSDDNAIFDCYIGSSLNSFFSTKDKNYLDYIRFLVYKEGGPASTKFFIPNNKLKIDGSGMFIPVFLNVTPDDRNKAGRVMRMHRALKDCRNTIAHCEENRADMSDIKEVLELYVRETKELFKRYRAH